MYLVLIFHQMYVMADEMANMSQKSADLTDVESGLSLKGQDT